MKIAFIGGGNMASAIVRGLYETPHELYVSEPSARQRETLQRQFPRIGIVDDNRAAARAVDVVVLAVKPQVMRSVCEELAAAKATQRRLFVSIAAGVTLDSLSNWLGGGESIVRAMPNQPAFVGCSMTVLAAAASTPGRDREAATSVMAAVGETLWLPDESMMDAATAIAGSGPAYFFLLMELLIEAAEEFGFAAADARRLVLRTAAGASELANVESASPAELRARVTSPGGTTAAALDSLDAAGIRAIFRAALVAARDRGRELAGT